MSPIPPASQILELDLRSERVFEEGISHVCAAEVEGGGDTGVGPGDPTAAAVWACYFNWSLERLQDKDSFKTVERKVHM